MRKPKTIKGYMKLLKEVADISADELNGWNKLSVDAQKEISVISAEIYNCIGEVSHIVGRDTTLTAHF